MQFILGKRGSGKTTRLVQDCIKEGAILLVKNRDIARNISSRNPNLRGKVFSWNEVKGISALNNISSNQNTRVYIDNIDLFLSDQYKNIVGVSVDAPIPFVLDKQILVTDSNIGKK